ncbi:hypothetical protein [Streptomyces sp. NPDC004285]
MAALLVYGVVQLLGEDPGNGEGKGGRARALSAVEAEQMLPGLTDLSGAWETEQPVHLRESDAKCHNVVAGYESQDRDGSGFSDLKVRYDTYACPDTAIAGRGLLRDDPERDQPQEQEGEALSQPHAGGPERGQYL